MSDPISKLQPHRTIHLQGISDFGAAAAIHHASDTGFTASGVFRDAADFCVIRLWDRDDFFGHPRFSNLPDPDFTGIVLTFDLAYENLQPIDSPKFATIDWPYVNCRTTAGALVRIPLFADATQVAGDYLVLNRAARDWHADHFAELESAGLEIVCAFSQELVLPPDDPPTAVWVQRYPDGEPVATATGFGDKLSNHCAFAPPFRDYIKQAYEEIAELMESAGLEARLQFGEVLWWFFPNASGMAFYDAYTPPKAAPFTRS